MGVDLHRRVGRRAPARALRDFLDEAADLLGVRAARAAAAGARRRAAWDAIVDTALPPGDELRALIDAGDHEARWALQASATEAWELPALTEPVRRCTRPKSRLKTTLNGQAV